jgi:hypothetical protein
MDISKLIIDIENSLEVGILDSIINLNNNDINIIKKNIPKIKLSVRKLLIESFNNINDPTQPIELNINFDINSV